VGLVSAAAVAAVGRCYDSLDVVTTYGRMLANSSPLHVVGVRLA